MSKINAVRETLDSLIKEKEGLLGSEHFSVRYGSESDIRALERVKEMLNEIEEEEKKDSSEMTLEEFKDSGLLWFVNQNLHMFGVAIAMNLDRDRNPISLYPVRCSFRGFDEETNDWGYQKVTEFISKNINKMVDDVKEK